ncbi:MAG: Gfo/Idh/MocA family oxidoreductase [Nitrospinota bacterium]|nr:Gfo/Idh/MocA family oxidoreductase [Nitrospinota bacterium]
MNKRIVRLGSVGLGKWAHTLARASQNTGNIDLRLCFDPQQEVAEQFSNEFNCEISSSLEEILNTDKIDGVIIATPHSTHAEIVCEAATCKKDIFIEKPFTLNVEDAHKCISVATENNIILQVGHKRRWINANKKLKQFVDSGKLGVVHHLEANYSKPIMQKPKDNWRNNPLESPAGGMTALGIHMVDLLFYLSGKAKRLSAFSKKLHGKSNLDDVTSILFEFENGQTGYVATSVVVPFNLSAAVYGTEANAWSYDDGKKMYFQTKDESSRKEIPIETNDCVMEELKHFAECIISRETPLVSCQEGLEIIATLEAILVSSNTSKVVDLDQFR